MQLFSSARSSRSCAPDPTRRLLALVLTALIGLGPIPAAAQVVHPVQSPVRSAVVPPSDLLAEATVDLNFAQRQYKVAQPSTATTLGGELLSGAWTMSVAGGTSTATESPAGTLTLTGDGTNSAIGDKAVTTVVGRQYRLDAVVGLGGVALRMGPTQGSQATLSQVSLNDAASAQSTTFVATATTTWIRFSRAVAGSTQVSALSVREVVPIPSGSFWYGSDERRIPGFSPGDLGAGTFLSSPDSASVVYPFSARRTNLLTYSGDFTNAAWGKTVLSLSGTANDWQAAAATATGSTVGAISQSVSTSDSVTTAFVVDVKPGTKSWAYISIYNGGSVGVRQSFNLSTGQVGSASNFNGGVQVGSATMTPLPGGGYRLAIARQGSGATGSLGGRVGFADADGAPAAMTTTSGDVVGYVRNADLRVGSSVDQYIPTTSAAVTVTDLIRTNLGAEVWEGSTNVNRNTAFAGAAAGSPGTMPTNMSTSLGTGISREVIGAGTENGVPYLEMRLYGTSSIQTIGEIVVDPLNASLAPAAQNDIWTASAFLRLTGGSTTNVLGVLVDIYGRNSGGTAVNNAVGSHVTLSSGLSRAAVTLTMSNATVAYVNSKINIIGTSAGVPVDLTFRIYAPQLEKKSFATPGIVTAVAAVRAAGGAVLTGAGPSLGYTLFVEADVGAVNTGVNRVLVDLGPSRGAIFITSANQIGNALTSVAGLTATANPGGVVRAAATFAAGAQSLCVNGAVIGSTSNAAADGSGRDVYIGRSSASLTQLANAKIRRVLIIPRVLSSAECAALTSTPGPLGANDNAPLPAALRRALGVPLKAAA